MKLQPEVGLTDLNLSADELWTICYSKPHQVLAYPPLDLLNLENPRLVLRIKVTARGRILEIRLDRGLKAIPMLDLRRAAIKAVRRALPRWAKWSPRVDLPNLRPETALTIAELFCEGKTTRKALSWAGRFADTFTEIYMSKKASKTERSWRAAGKELAELCRGVCTNSRKDLWHVIESVSSYEPEGIDGLASIIYLEGIADELGLK